MAKKQKIVRMHWFRPNWWLIACW